MLSQKHAQELIAQMSAKGILFTDGMSEDKLLEVEDLLGGRMPQDLRTFLSLAIPVSIDGKAGKFPRWDTDIKQAVNSSQAFVNELFKADIEQSDYWNSQFGERPEDAQSAWAQAQRTLDSQPRLIPVFGHRYMIMDDDNSPVLSYHGPMDTIIYGDCLADYLCNEFDLERPQWIKSAEPALGFWSDIVDF